MQTDLFASERKSRAERMHAHAHGTLAAGLPGVSMPSVRGQLPVLRRPVAGARLHGSHQELTLI